MQQATRKFPRPIHPTIFTVCLIPVPGHNNTIQSDQEARSSITIRWSQLESFQLQERGALASRNYAVILNVTGASVFDHPC